LLQAAADIVAALPDAVVITASDRRVLAANQAGADLLGWQVADVVGQAIADNVSRSEPALFTRSVFDDPGFVSLCLTIEHAVFA